MIDIYLQLSLRNYYEFVLKITEAQTLKHKISILNLYCFGKT